VLFNEASLEFWESRLRAGKHYTAVGGSDSHFLSREHHARLAHPTVWLHCEGEPSAPKLLNALRAGHVILSENPHGARLMLNAGDAMMGDSVDRPADGQLRASVCVIGGAGSTLELHTAMGCVHRQVIPDDEVCLELNADVSTTPYVRAQLVEAREQATFVRALTNPIYLR
jgi:hypothetical protein